MEKMKDLTLKLDGNAQIIGLLSSNIEFLNKVSKLYKAIYQLNQIDKT